jgi:cytochrome c oxidase assembly protein subunit 15
LVRAWLWVVAGFILAMVVVGGATRLTQSGLSITEWQPIMGILPPLNLEAWQAEFAKYRQIPQYRLLFPDMDLDGFKTIFYWEWAHRLLGRLIGLVFALPLVLFWLTGCLPAPLKPRLVGLLLLGGLQGLIGWWMVKSGLVARTEVSHYRLAVHLLVASATLGAAIWLAEGLRPAPAQPVSPRLSGGASLLIAAIVLQLGLGALVAGLHAGLVFNTWPLIDGRLIPPLGEVLADRPLVTNVFENVLTVQFDHRMMAYFVFGLVLLHAVRARRIAPHSPEARRAAVLVVLVALQAGLGITTLLLVVPLWAALLHQAFAMALLGLAVLHRRRMGPAGAERFVAAQAPPRE